jgi:hypothetical protein
VLPDHARCSKPLRENRAAVVVCRDTRAVLLHQGTLRQELSECCDENTIRVAGGVRFIGRYRGAVARSARPGRFLAGSWQGTLRIDSDLKFRVVARITRGRVAGWNGTMYVENANPIPVESVMVGGSTIELIANSVRFRGEINADGTSIRGMWIHGIPRPVDRPFPVLTSPGT